MSWFARSIANSLRLDDDDDDVSSDKPATEKQQTHDDDSSPVSPSRGVKEDFSELTKTLTRQFWGVASFLAPPPQSEPDKRLLDPNLGTAPDSDDEESDPAGIAGLRSDIAEIGGRFKSGISKFSKNIPVSEITKMASNLLQLGPEEEEEEDKRFGSGRGAVGVTEEVVAFVRDVAMHPETWLDFPLFDDEGDEVDFDLSDAQQEHALAVERLAPRLAALRIELCPGYMSEARFWEIYFVLLHPRLDKQDAELLSTPQEKMLYRGGSQHEEMLAVPSTALSTDVVQDVSSVDAATSSTVAGSGTDVHPVLSENQTVDKLVVEEGPITLSKGEKLQSVPVKPTCPLRMMRTCLSVILKRTIQICLSRDTSSIKPIGSVKENVQNPDNKESNDWLDIDDLEVA